MGKFSDSFLTGFREGQNRAKNASLRMRNSIDFPVKVTATGRNLRLEVIEPDVHISKMHMDNLKNFAKSMENYGASYTVVSSTIIQIVFPSCEMAETVCRSLR